MQNLLYNLFWNKFYSTYLVLFYFFFIYKNIIARVLTARYISYLLTKGIIIKLLFII